MKWLNKKILLATGLLLLGVSLLMMEELGVCDSVLKLQTSCLIPTTDLTEWLIFTLMITILPTVVLLYCLKDRVFVAWKKFAIFAIPVVLVLIYFFTWMDSGSSGWMNIKVAPTMISLIYGIYFTISLIIITLAWWKSRSK